LGYWLDITFLHAKNHPMDGGYAYLPCNNFQCWYYDWQMKKNKIIGHFSLPKIKTQKKGAIGKQMRVVRN
jgi:hypothetical protein